MLFFFPDPFLPRYGLKELFYRAASFADDAFSNLMIWFCKAGEFHRRGRPKQIGVSEVQKMAVEIAEGFNMLDGLLPHAAKRCSKRCSKLITPLIFQRNIRSLTNSSSPSNNFLRIGGGVGPNWHSAWKWKDQECRSILLCMWNRCAIAGKMHTERRLAKLSLCKSRKYVDENYGLGKEGRALPRQRVHVPCGKHFEHNQQVGSSHPCWEDCLLGPWPSYMMHPLFFSLTPLIRSQWSMVNPVCPIGQPCFRHSGNVKQFHLYITVCRNAKIQGALRSQGAVLLDTIAIFLPCGQLRLAIRRLKLKKHRTSSGTLRSRRATNNVRAEMCATSPNLQPTLQFELRQLYPLKGSLSTDVFPPLCVVKSHFVLPVVWPPISFPRRRITYANEW